MLLYSDQIYIKHDKQIFENYLLHVFRIICKNVYRDKTIFFDIS